MKTFLFAALVLAISAVIAAKLKAGQRSARIERFGKRQVITKNEQPMFFRLLQVFPPPEYVVLAQVSFGALLTAKKGTSSNRFTQKRADFVVLDKGLQVLAVVELDDSSHAGRELQDADRDAMLSSAGYRVLRYKAVPDIDRLRADLAPPPIPDPKPGRAALEATKGRDESAALERREPTL